MKKFIPKKYRFILILAMVFGLLLGLKLIIPKPEPQLVGIEPPDQAMNIALNSEIKIEFDQNINEKGWQPSFSPSLPVKLQAKKNVLRILPQENFKPETVYKFEITNPKYPNLKIASSFITINKEGIIPSEENIIRYYEDLDKETYEGMPLFDYVPFYADNFSLDYIAPLTLEIILRKDTQVIRQEVLDWMESKAVDPESHKFEWKVKK
jgi:hypothetical protein